MGNVGETRVVQSSLESLQVLRWAAVVQRLPVPGVQHELHFGDFGRLHGPTILRQISVVDFFL